MLFLTNNFKNMEPRMRGCTNWMRFKCVNRRKGTKTTVHFL